MKKKCIRKELKKDQAYKDKDGRLFYELEKESITVERGIYIINGFNEFIAGEQNPILGHTCNESSPLHCFKCHTGHPLITTNILYFRI